MISQKDCLRMDEEDPMRGFRQRFLIPKGTIYFDGNSLGPLPRGAAERVQAALHQQWGEDLITSWNKHGWFRQPLVTGNKIARLIGAAPDSVVVADSISVDMFKLLTSALALRRDRRVILSDSGNFPSDLYVAQGLNNFLADGHTLRVVAPEAIAQAITEEVAVVMLTEVDYRTGRRHDMKAITELAHERGALVIWDLAHSVGAVPVDLMAADADFAVGCTYKYLNGGPGAPAFLFVHPRLQAEAMPALAGWWGHAEPFAFSPDFKAADGIVRQQCGTQPILSLAALDAAMDVWADVDMAQLHQKAQKLCSLFILLVETHCSKFGLELAGPRDMAARGSHVSFQCPEGYAVMQALIARKVIGDFRAPNMIRFGFAPLYNSFVEVHDAAMLLADILKNKAWNRVEYLQKKAVT